MTIKKSYTVKNLTVSSLTIDNLHLEKYESRGIVFLTDGIKEAEANNLISVTKELSDAEIVENLEAFIADMRTDNGVYPVGTVVQ